MRTISRNSLSIRSCTCWRPFLNLRTFSQILFSQFSCDIFHTYWNLCGGPEKTLHYDVQDSGHRENENIEKRARYFFSEILRNTMRKWKYRKKAPLKNTKEIRLLKALRQLYIYMELIGLSVSSSHFPAYPSCAFFFPGKVPCPLCHPRSRFQFLAP